VPAVVTAGFWQYAPALKKRQRCQAQKFPYLQQSLSRATRVRIRFREFQFKRKNRIDASLGVGYFKLPASYEDGWLREIVGRMHMNTKVGLAVPMRHGTKSWRWLAVKNRQADADGRFVFAVRTTRIYCRPTCPSRRPQPRNVVFFRGPREAEQAGFRACLRCRPNVSSPDSDAARLVDEVCRKMQMSLANDSARRLTLAELSASAGVSTHKLERLFLRILGITPRQFIDARRMAHLRRSLRKGEKVAMATYDAGFGSSSRLYERAPEQMGMTPAVYRRGGEGMKIAYTVAPCSLGQVLVAATERGVSAVYLGDSASPLEKALVSEYPRAEIRQDSNGMSKWVRGVLKHLRGCEPHESLPIDVQATAFQRRVWEELRRIPYGSTRTYTEIARAIGKPRAVRAVARACATNPVSVVVPCHRVVRGDGSLAGYRWGLERKRALLDSESTAVGPRNSNKRAQRSLAFD
jgi:AraC family transcriptional regulator, regulatory protein of adaptative response / methylated-DNA-[protein]-cysteine methyltransferase